MLEQSEGDFTIVRTTLRHQCRFMCNNLAVAHLHSFATLHVVQTQPPLPSLSARR